MNETNAIKIYAAMFALSEEELLERINESHGEDWVRRACFVIEPPSARCCDLTKRGDREFSVGIYMDKVEEWMSDYEKGVDKYFPDPQIDYGDTHVNMSDDGRMDFDPEVFARVFCNMVDHEVSCADKLYLTNADRYFGIIGFMNYLNKISFNEMIEISERLKKTKDIESFLEDMGMKAPVLEEENTIEK